MLLQPLLTHALLCPTLRHPQTRRSATPPSASSPKTQQQVSCELWWRARMRADCPPHGALWCAACGRQQRVRSGRGMPAPVGSMPQHARTQPPAATAVAVHKRHPHDPLTRARSAPRHPTHTTHTHTPVLDDSANALFMTEIVRGMAYTIKAYFDPKVRGPPRRGVYCVCGG
jgi:hypothetical protein